LVDGTIYCPRCGTHSQSITLNAPIYNFIKYWKTNVAGILILLAAIYCLILGIYMISLFNFSKVNSSPGDLINIFVMIAIILNLIGFFLGFKGALMTFKRENFKFAITASWIVLIAGVTTIIFQFLTFTYIFTSRILIFIIIGLMLLSLSKDEFSDSSENHKINNKPPVEELGKSKHKNRSIKVSD
jgi:FlaA1/EpsC-like NDP-sugar epimerase